VTGSPPDSRGIPSRSGGPETASGDARVPKPGAAGIPLPTLCLFEGYGIELEYMIVDSATLDIVPAADRVLEAVAGESASEVDLGPLSWSNELVLHVLEMKTNGPAPSLQGLAALFQADVSRANGLLRPLGAALLPGGMHPWMDPATETRIWPHEYTEVYRAYDRIFGCRGHGWSNLQSTHINLPFSGDREFARLHAAIRAVLPLIPAIAASTPVAGGQVTGFADTRLEYYRRNQGAVPEIAGQVIPESVRSIQEYHDRILSRIYRAMAPHDPDGILQYEWLNSRGAIARFDRGAIEIRLIDIQECPAADIAVAALVSAVVQALCEERWAPLKALLAIPDEPLVEALSGGIRHGERAVIEDPALLSALGLPEHGPHRPVPAGEVWRRLARELLPPGTADREGWDGALDTIFRQGTLSTRILRALGPGPDSKAMRRVYRRLQTCLASGIVFDGTDPASLP